MTQPNRKKREALCWIFTIAIALALVAFAAATQTISYYDNDDFNIAWALSGNRSGAPSYSHPFVNILLAAAVSGLYAVVPQLPWWLIVQLAFMALGIAALGLAAMRISMRRGHSLLLPLCAMGLLCAALFYYPMALVTFTTTSAVAGLGGAALAIGADAADTVRRQRFDCIAGVILMALSVLMRRTTGLCVLCFYLAGMLYRFLLYRGAKDSAACKRTAIAAVSAVLIALALSLVYAWGREAGNPAGFLAFEDARALYMDYPHATFASDPALYASVGWDETLYELTTKWFYMDARINAETLGTIVATSGTAMLPLRSAIAGIFGFLGKYPVARYLALLCGAAYLIGLIGWLFDRKRVLPMVIDTCVLLGTAFLCLYLGLRGRLNLRAWMAVLLPAVATMALSALMLLPSCRAKGDKPQRRRIVSCAACLLVFAVALFGGYRIFRTVLSYDDSTEAMLDKAHAVVEYALQHPENVYIRDVYAANSFDALTVYTAQKPVNLMDWGGCDMYTKARAAQYEVNGLHSPYADVFLQDNVYYVAERDGACLAPLARYMAADWGANQYEIVDTIDETIVVVKFSKG